MLIGYARVSTEGQSLDLQNDALKKNECENIFSDVASGAKTDRPGLMEAIKMLRKGDTFVVWRLDRLGRSMSHLIETIKEFEKKGVAFRSLQENMDTNTNGGKLIFHMFGALAEFERGLIQERVQAGLKAARARGRHGGRPFKMTKQKLQMASTLLRDSKQTFKTVSNTLGVSIPTLYRYVSPNGDIRINL